MIRSRLSVLCALALSVAVFAPSCAALKDAEPWTQTITYDDNGGKGPLTITPTELVGDSAFGQVQVVNNTITERAFSIDDLSVYEKIPAEQSRLVEVGEAKNHRTYTFYDQLHPNEIRGTLKIEYKSKEQR